MAYNATLVIKTVSSGFSNEPSIFLAHFLGSRCLSNHPGDEITAPFHTRSVCYCRILDEWDIQMWGTL